MRAFFRKLLAAEHGATAVEYGLIISLIVLAMVSVLTEVASKTTGMWNHVANEVTNH
ncbi:MAG: pilus assembly protein [Sphingobium sp. 66-54]|nr:MAG: pilus assembly protein [Sphingobium sp. 66-54]